MKHISFRYYFLFIAMFFGGASNLFAEYKIKCNSEQTQCETETKRLVKGDKVGIFDDEKYLVATGVVTGIKGQLREVKIIKKYGKIGANCQLDRIEDIEFKEPNKHLKVKRTVGGKSFGVQAGLLSIGAGAGLSAFELDGLMQWRWRESSYFLVKGMFAKGSGKATLHVDELQQHDVSVQAMAAAGGMAFDLTSIQSVDFRSEVDLGFVNMSVTSDVSSVKDLLNSKIYPGTGLLLGANASMVSHLPTWDFVFTLQFWVMQSSYDYSVLGGFIKTI